MIKDKNKVRLGILILSVFVFITSVSYAIWSMTLQQESTNVVNTACFKINFKDQNEINLQSAYPISDAEGMNLTPYTFTIENICNTTATYQINIEELTSESKKLSTEYIKVSLNNSKGKLLNTYETVEKTLSNAESSKKLITGVLKASESKTFELRLWLDENTPANPDVMNATFQSKITIIAVQKEGIPEVNIVASEKQDGITVDISTVENPKNETLTYFYQLNEEVETESEENTHTFAGLSDGKYKAKGRAETLDGVILEEKELEVTVAYETVYVSASGNDETGNGAIDNPFASLQPAYNKVKSGGEILLLSDLTATHTTNMNIENKEVSLKSNGENIYTILKDPSFTTQILDIANSNTVTTTNITFDGNEISSTNSLIEARNSILNLNVGTTVKRNIHTGGYNADWASVSSVSGFGGGLYVSNGTLNINGATISDNSANLNISGNMSLGGGIFVYKGVCNFNSGNIVRNSTVWCGGGIAIADSSLIMNDGNISFNNSVQGGGVEVYAQVDATTMTMNGGTISNNTATYGGGIHAGRENGTSAAVYIKDGIISGNTAPTGANTYTANGAQIIDQRTS